MPSHSFWCGEGGADISFFDLFTKRSSNTSSNRKQRVFTRDLVETLRRNYKADFGSSIMNSATEEQLSDFAFSMEEELAKHVNQQGMVLSPQNAENIHPVDAKAFFFVMEDRMTAYACILPPLGGGSDITPERLNEDMFFDGICCGIDNEIIARVLAEKWYLHIFRVAKGILPQDGKDGCLVSELLENRKIHVEPDGSETPDLTHSPTKLVRKGEVICRVQPPSPAIDGHLVTGQVLPAREGQAVPPPVGENTILSEDGQILLAAVDGIAFFENGCFSVQGNHVLTSDVDASIGRLTYDGSLYIGGNVQDNATIQCTGNLVVAGQVLSGNIIAGGSIRVLKGIIGQGETTLQAGNEVQCPLIQNAAVTAKGNIHTEVILNSNVTSDDGSIYATIGRGLIVGGRLRACNSIYAKRIGNLSGAVVEIIVGYSSAMARQLMDLQQGLENIRNTLEHLRKSIVQLRVAGNNLSNAQRAVLTRLVEQRMLYERQEVEQTRAYRDLEQNTFLNSDSRIICDELLPSANVHIGRKTLFIQTKEVKCNIHLYSGRIAIR